MISLAFAIAGPAAQGPQRAQVLTAANALAAQPVALTFAERAVRALEWLSLADTLLADQYDAYAAANADWWARLSDSAILRELARDRQLAAPPDMVSPLLSAPTLRSAVLIIPPPSPNCRDGSTLCVTWEVGVGRRGRGALEGKGPLRRPQNWWDRRLEEVAQAVGGGYKCH